AAYAPQSSQEIPEDFQRALEQNPKAHEFFKTLRGARRYSFLYRIQDAKRPETRARRISEFVTMLAEGRTHY
ncbi:MAG TPA: YdeI/OmpD-associated family protein, partial [Solirubrobacteraceae bacterium]|nr:YdeI/OmpD-associated family protein [Solirubrobacteraceae bacterium]